MKNKEQNSINTRDQISLRVPSGLMNDVYEHQERMSKRSGGAKVSFNLAFLNLTQTGVNFAKKVGE